ncbi:MAG: 3-phosphoshikimate 1-carboxyvinyltransferase [Chitinophagia bacterium]|jgi:3-phosphoshikimate 1-carboxyvinyltransferase|nr:3-phosphoshikimate 1-carboxyvinyltransferase [Chitinophagia bacterium]
MLVTVYPAKLKGVQMAPASKSSMQRACAAALLHEGETVIHNPGHSNDDIAALDVIQKLGAQVFKTSNSIVIHSKGVMPVGPEMNCGESGLGIRMFTPIAALSAKSITIQGKGSLVKRPMHFFDEILPQLDVSIHSQKGFLPIEIQGPLKPNTITVDGSLSSQFLTGLLMAYAASNATEVSIYVKDLKSKPYIDLTLHVLNTFGWKVTHKDYQQFKFLPHAPLAEHIEYTVEGDWSGAAFLLVSGAIAGPILVKGLQMDSTQADRQVMGALQKSNASIEITSEGILMGPPNDTKGLQCFEFDATDCPDLFPPLVALAANCKGISIIKGVSRLAHKESNRGLTLQAEFAKMGVKLDLQGDDMKIYGGAEIQSSTVFSQHDHRIAMACAVATLNSNGPVQIIDAEAINKSYTDFFEHLRHLGARVDIE